MKRITSCLLLFQLLINNTASAQVSSPPDYTAFITKYRSVFTDEMKANHIAGLSIAIVDGDSLVWCEGFGYYNEKEKKPVTGHTPLNIGSICKTFTGLAVLQLQEQGKLNIDRPFKSYIPEFRMKSLFGSVDSILVRDFMTHHAGVPDFIRDKLSDNPPDFTTVLDYVNNDYATSAPNTVSAYSNAGISLLGNLIEKVSGESYFSVVQKQILDPLDMTESGFTTGMLPEPVSLGYNSRGEEMKELKVLDAPAGCLYSSAYDMAKYIKAMLKKGTYKHHQLISPATFAEMTRTQNEDVFLDFGNPSGLTWTIYFNDAGKCIEHAGGTINHRAELCIAPDAGIGIIIMSNSSNGGMCMYRENYDLFSEILKLKGQKPVVSVKPVPNKRHPEHHFKFRDNEKSVLTELSDATLKEIAGQYGTFGMTYSINLVGNRLHTNIWGQNWTLFPVENKEFVSSNDTVFDHADLKCRYYFEKVNGRLVLVQTNEGGTHQVFGERMEETPLSGLWKNRTGSYRIEGANKEYQMFSDFSLDIVNGIVIIKGKLNIELGPPYFTIPLRIVSDDLAVVYGYGRFCGSAVQFSQKPGEKEVMSYMGFSCVKAE